MQYKNDITFETTLYSLDDHNAGIFFMYTRILFTNSEPSKGIQN